jgi:signal transduction histidine kinase
MGAAWWRRAIERRLSAVTLMAVVLWIAVTVGAGTIVANRVTRILVDERASRARHIASRIEGELEEELRRLDRIAAILERTGESVAVAAAVQDLRLADVALRIDQTGRVIWARSVSRGQLMAPPVATVDVNRGRRWRAQPTDLLDTSEGSRALLLMPVRESDPGGGALAAVIPPDAAVLASMLSGYRDEPFFVSLLDARGSPIARSRASPEDPEPLLASAPVLRTSWTVRISQPRREALASMWTLMPILAGGAILLAGVAITMAWGAARSIRQPVERLTDAAEQLAAGRLDRPIVPAGPDEIGRLSEALERLRQALQADERRSRLLRRVLSAQEDERRRIARELHDETTQQLTALGIQLDMAAHEGVTRPSLLPARDLVNTMIDGLHRVIYDLRPSMLDDLGLLPAIREYARVHLQAKGIVVHCECADTPPPLGADAQTAVYRVVQEALTNVMRHAHAEAVQIACSVSSDALTIEVEDDGVGFDPERVSQPRSTGEGLGLLGMRERLALLGGTITIDAAPGSGTRVTVSVPLRATMTSREEVPA